MAEIDQDILLGRLAVHYKILSKEQAQQAIRLWRATSAGQDLGEFLVTESYIPGDALPKLQRARVEYLRRSEAKSAEDEAPPAAPRPAAPRPAAPQPAAPQPATPQPAAPRPAAPVPLAGAATVRITPEMMAAAIPQQSTAAPPPPAHTVAMTVEPETFSPEPESFELPEPEPSPPLPAGRSASGAFAPELPEPEPPAPELPAPEPFSFELPTPEPAAFEPAAFEPAAFEPAGFEPAGFEPTAPAASPEPDAPGSFEFEYRDEHPNEGPDLRSLSVEELSAPTPADEGEAPESAHDPVSLDSIEVASESGHLLRVGPGVTLEELLRQACKIGASDLHVHSGAPLKLRIHGVLSDASGQDVDGETARELIYGILTGEQRELLEEHQQLDFAFEISGAGRFRANSYFQHRGLDGVFRIIPPQPPTLEALGLPVSLGRFSEYHQGIVLFTGPAGCGKSSTMAALVRMINETRSEHILTIEDPIEYVHVPATCVVNQREVGPHTESFARALRAALREDPDIIVIGELRDLETISLALTAAETGHLVLGTLHTASTIPTLNRMFGVFPPDQQPQIRTMVSESLRAIVSQRLVPREDGEGRVPALEILINNRAIGNLVRENRTFQIKSILQTSGQAGMCELDASLAELLKKRIISKETAKREAIEPKRFE